MAILSQFEIKIIFRNISCESDIKNRKKISSPLCLVSALKRHKSGAEANVIKLIKM